MVVERVDDLLSRLEKESGLTLKELEDMVKSKEEKLSGLVTKEGAIHLVAKELGVNLLDSNPRKLELANVLPGMRNVNVVGRVFKISQINEFKRSNGSTGRVANVFIGDDTGFVRLPLWNDQVEFIEDGKINVGDVIKVMNAFAKESVYGNVELSMGKFGTVQPVEESELAQLFEHKELPSVKELVNRFLSSTSEKKSVEIRGLSPGAVEIRGSIVQVFNSNFFVCPQCGSTLSEDKCAEHGKVEPKPELVFSCVLDDGTGSVRVVFFRSLAERLVGKKAEEFLKLDEKGARDAITGVLGKEIVVEGNARVNKAFDRLEIVATNFEDLNIIRESDKLAKKIELKIGRNDLR